MDSYGPWRHLVSVFGKATSTILGASMGQGMSSFLFCIAPNLPVTKMSDI